MSLDAAAIELAVKQQVLRIARELGADDVDLDPDEIIPATGLIDSAGLLELIAWFEAAYDIRVPAEEFTIDNLGTLRAMASYVRRRKGLE